MNKKGYFNIITYFLICTIGLYTGVCKFEFGYEETNPADNFLFVDSLPMTTIYDYGCCVHTEINETYSTTICNSHGDNPDPICLSNETKQITGSSSGGKYNLFVRDIKLDNLTIEHLKEKVEWD